MQVFVGPKGPRVRRGGEPGGGEEDHAEEGDEVHVDEVVGRGRDAGDEAEGQAAAQGSEVTVQILHDEARVIPGLVRVRGRPGASA